MDSVSSRKEQVQSMQNYSVKVDPEWKLDNFVCEHILMINDLRVKGFQSVHGVLNFLGIPYARLAARFLSARLLDIDKLSGNLDATLYGPRCPQGADVPHLLFGNLFEKLGNTRRMSEMDCLTVNIYTPPGLRAGQKVPVFAYIHGGAFAHGDSGPEQDGNHLVKRSVALGQPIVVVSIAYRLNFFGFLTSKELLEDQVAHGEQPITAQGCNDQRIALQWIQKHIEYFGGDLARVTLAGESAGAHSVWQQMKGNEPNLFSRANIRSFPPGRNLPFEETQRRFDGIIEKLGIAKDAPGVVKVAALRSLSAQELVSFWDGSPFPPVLDTVWMAEAKPGVAFGSVEYFTDAPEWLDAVMIGCTRDEAYLFSGSAWDHFTWEEARAGLEEVLPQHIVETIVESQVWKHAKSPVDAFNKAVSDASFVGGGVQGSEKLAQRNKGLLKTYAYIMECPDTRPGPLQGYDTHATDVSTVFYQPAQQEWPERATVADQHTRHMLDFIYGKEPRGWDDVGREGKYMAYTGKESCMKHLHQDRKDREIVFDNPEDQRVFYLSGFGIIGASLRKLNDPDKK